MEKVCYFIIVAYTHIMIKHNITAGLQHLITVDLFDTVL